jgi:hypothetical protein
MGARTIGWCGLVLVCACGGGGGGGGDDGDDDGNNPTDAALTDAADDDAALADGPPPDGAVASMMIGAAGGTLTTSDGVVLSIPAGALAADTMITITYAGNGLGMNTVSNVYDLAPDGTQFAIPVALTIPYDPSRLTGLPEEELAVGWYGDGQFTTTGWTLIDGARDTATSYLTHFSQWAVIPAPAGGGCSPNQACIRSCASVQVPDMCCAAFGTTCKSKLTRSFPSFVRCYSQCVGTPQAANFHNSRCMADCCTGQGWTVQRQGACYRSNGTQAQAMAVRDCAAGCFGANDETSICTTQPIIFQPCSWQTSMMPATMGDQCTMQVGDGLDSQLLATELGPVLAQTWGNPATVSVTGGAFDASSISISLTCATAEPGSGAMNGTWNGQMFTGSWTLGSDSGNFNVSPNW